MSDLKEFATPRPVLPIPAEMDEERTIYGALMRAGELREELSDKVHGPLRRYVDAVREQAIVAGALLFTADPRDFVTIHKAQRDIAAWSDAMAWIRTQLEDGAVAEAQAEERLRGDDVQPAPQEE